MIGRLSTQLMFNMLGGQISSNQARVFDLSNKISTQKKFIRAYDDPAAATEAMKIQTRLGENQQRTRDRVQAQQELELGELALRGMENLLQRMREIAVAAGNDVLGPDERAAYATEAESIVDSYTQLVNTKVNGNYVFSGQQSDLVTLRLADGAPYGSAIFKHNSDDGKQRMIDAIPSSVDIKDSLISAASSATMTSGVINPVTTVAGDLDFEINDGNGTITSFTASIGIGDTLSTIISTINTAFITAGGPGAIAQESPAGYLNLDTALATGSTAGSVAKIQLLSSSDTDLANELYLSKQIFTGKEAGVYNTFEALKTALDNNDPVTIRGLIDDFDFNMKQVNDLTATMGLRIARVENLDSLAEDVDYTLQSNLSTVQDIDMVKASLDIANAQAALETSISSTSTFFRQSLRDFLR
ncbi:MAG: flagellar hook-associated protein FlgL [Cyanobacteria bacterium]|nr:flagellar hook-associated protein FlgL [Cyanobacteriota bacterium]MDA1020665.1 flagellar hook-associated protein FlgL [Cyanobacteriota bacterium]